MKKRLRVIIVGCGYFGQKRIQACLQLRSLVDITGIVDTDIANAKKAASSLHVPFAKTIKELLKITPGDVAIVAVPNRYHAPITCEALRCGLHVLCEKPLAISTKEAKKIVAASHLYRRFVKTGSNHRFFPTIQKLHSVLVEGKVGTILSLYGTIGNNGEHTKNSWFWEKHISGGGTYIDNACHVLDIARWCMGDFTTCTGMTQNTFWKQSDVEDIACGIYTTKQGQIANISSSWTQWDGYLSLKITGTKGYVCINSANNNQLIVGDKNGHKKIYDFSNKQPSSYQDELSYFVSCIHSNRQPFPNAADGVAVIQMIEAVYKANKTKRVVHIMS